MHIPDGFLSLPVAAGTTVLAIAGMAIAIRDVKNNLPERKVPLLGLAAAFIFAAQMLNFPVAAGTSGHLTGATLATVLLGPSAAVIVISAVLILQCLMFADGGITALGANIFNLAVVAPVVSYATYRFILGFGTSTNAEPDLFKRLLAILIAAWLSIVVASVFCAFELALSNAAALQLVLPAMSGVHMVIGLGEAAITAFVIANIIRLRPDLLGNNHSVNNTAGNGRSFLALGLIVSLALAIFVSPFASSSPDGLEFVAEQLGFIASGTNLLTQAPLPDYSVPGIESVMVGSLLVGVIGTLSTFVFAWFFARWLSAQNT
jgi:cobalt/nickel transport system permease protein